MGGFMAFPGVLGAGRRRRGRLLRQIAREACNNLSVGRGGGAEGGAAGEVEKRVEEKVDKVAEIT